MAEEQQVVQQEVQVEQMNGEQILEGLRAEAKDIWRFLDGLRVLRRRTVDEDTNLAIKRAFPDMTEADCKIKRGDGKTLYERVKERKEQRGRGDEDVRPMGAAFYRELREQYQTREEEEE